MPAKKRLLRNKKGQVETGDGPVLQLMKYFFSKVTGTRGVEAPMGIRYLLVGDTANIARMRRDSVLDKSLRHLLERDLQGLEEDYRALDRASDLQKMEITSRITARLESFVEKYNQDFAYLADIANQDASLLSELAGYDVFLEKFVYHLLQEEFSKSEAERIFIALGKFTEEFDKDMKKLLSTAQSEYRDTVNVGQWAIQTNDTLDNIIRRVGRLVSRLNAEINDEIKDLKEDEEKADTQSTVRDAFKTIASMEKQLMLLLKIAQTDQVLIHELTKLGDKFRGFAKRLAVARSLPENKRRAVVTAVAILDKTQTEQLGKLRQTEQQLVYKAETIKNQMPKILATNALRKAA